MITLENMLPAAELTSFNDLVTQATTQEAGEFLYRVAAGELFFEEVNL